jgi:multiple sugar transport system substrate-binding protein
MSGRYPGFPMRIFRQLNLLVCLLLISGTLAAKEKINLFWPEYDGDTKSYTDSLQAAFNIEYPEIDLTIIRINWTFMEQHLLAHIAAKKEPNIAIVPNYWMPRFEQLSLLEPIGPYLDRQTKKNLSVSTYLNKKMMGVPMASGIRLMYYRDDLIPHAPKTFEEMLEMAKKIHNPPHLFGIGLVGQMYSENVDFVYYFYGNGGEYFHKNPDGSYGKSAVNSPAGIKALTFMNDLVHKYKVTQPYVNAYGRNDVQTLFVSGKIGFFLNVAATATLLENAKVPFSWKVAPMPGFKGFKPHPLRVTDSIIMFKRPGKFKAVGKFLDFFYQDQWRLPFDLAVGFPPVTKSLANHPRFKKPVYAIMRRLGKDAKSFPLVDNWTTINQILWSEFEEVYLGFKSPTDALNQAALKIDQLRGFQ